MLFGANYSIKVLDKNLFNKLQERFFIDKTFAILLANRINKIEEAKYFFSHFLQDFDSPFSFSFIYRCIKQLDNAIKNKEKTHIIANKDMDSLISSVILYDYLVEKGIEVEISLLSDCVKNMKKKSSSGVFVVILSSNISFNSDTYIFNDLSIASAVFKIIWANEFLNTGEYNKRRVLLSFDEYDNSIRVFVSYITNFTEETKDAIFNNKDDFLDSKLFENLKKENEILVYDDFDLNFCSFFNNTKTICECFNIDASMLDRVLNKCNLNQNYFENKQEKLIFLYKSLVFRKYPNISYDILKFLDLVAIAVVASKKELKNENRTFVKLGIDELNKRKRLNLQGIFAQRSNILNEIQTNDISSFLIPVFDSSIKANKSDLVLSLLLEKDVDMIDIFTRSICSQYQKQLDDEKKLKEQQSDKTIKKTTEIDIELDANDFTNDIIDYQQILLPYGPGCKEPVFLIKNAKITSLNKFLGYRNAVSLSLNLALGLGSIKAIIWDIGRFADNLKIGSYINVIAKIEKTYYKTFKEYRLNVIDIENVGNAEKNI